MAENDADGKAPESDATPDAPDAPEADTAAQDSGDDAAKSDAAPSDSKEKPKKAVHVDTNTKNKLREQRKRLRQKEFADSSLGWDKILAVGIPIALLILGLAGWRYHQAGEPERSLAAWYDQFRQATRTKDGKAMCELYSVAPRRDLMGAFNLHLVRQNMGEEAYQEALKEARIRRIDSDEQAAFEVFVGKLIEAGMVGLDKEPSGFAVTYEGAIGTVKVDGPDLRVERDKDGLWHFLELKKALPKGKVHREKGPAGSGEPE